MLEIPSGFAVAQNGHQCAAIPDSRLSRYAEGRQTMNLSDSRIILHSQIGRRVGNQAQDRSIQHRKRLERAYDSGAGNRAIEKKIFEQKQYVTRWNAL